MSQLECGAFVWGTGGSVLFSDYLFLPVQQHYVRLHLLEGVEAQARFINAHLFQLQFAQELRVVDAENEAPIRHIRLHQDFHQPLGWMQFLWPFSKLIEFPMEKTFAITLLT